MRANCTTAQAHPNIALLKYWGKQDAAGNIPAAPSLSITLDGLRTLTSVSEAREDAIRLNGALVQDRKILRALKDWRRDCRIPPLAIDTRNNFPTAAGLASSASGFAALATAVDAHCGLGLTAGERSALARRASASAARSIHGGFVALGPPDWQAAPLLGRASMAAQGRDRHRLQGAQGDFLHRRHADLAAHIALFRCLEIQRRTRLPRHARSAAAKGFPAPRRLGGRQLPAHACGHAEQRTRAHLLERRDARLPARHPLPARRRLPSLLHRGCRPPSQSRLRTGGCAAGCSGPWPMCPASRKRGLSG